MKNWKTKFREEFGIHFKKSPSELTFALVFIDQLLKNQKIVKNYRIVLKDIKDNWGANCKSYDKDCSSCEAKKVVEFLKKNIDLIENE